MSLIDDVRDAARRQGPTCSVGVVLAATPEPFLLELVGAINDDTLQARALSRVLRTKYDITLPDSAINRHRRGDCRCLS